MLACVYVAITNTYTAAHRELLDLVMAVKDSGCISQVEHVSKTKIRGLLALLKHDNLLIAQSMEGQPARLCFSPDIQSFYDLRMRHDRFLDRYMLENNLFVPEILRSELVWQIDEETYYNRMEGLNNLMKHVAEFYAGYLGVPLTGSSLSSQIPVRQMLPMNRNLLKDSQEEVATGVSAGRIYAQNHGSSASSCTTLSDSTNATSIFGQDQRQRNSGGSRVLGVLEKDTMMLDNSCYSSCSSPGPILFYSLDPSSLSMSLSAKEQKFSFSRTITPPNTVVSTPKTVDWYAAGCRTSSTVQTTAAKQQQPVTSRYLNRASLPQPAASQHYSNYGYSSGAHYSDSSAGCGGLYDHQSMSRGMEYSAYPPQAHGHHATNAGYYIEGQVQDYEHMQQMPPRGYSSGYADPGNRFSTTQGRGYAPQYGQDRGHADVHRTGQYDDRREYYESYPRYITESNDQQYAHLSEHSYIPHHNNYKSLPAYDQHQQQQRNVFEMKDMLYGLTTVPHDYSAKEIDRVSNCSHLSSLSNSGRSSCASLWDELLNDA